MDDPIFDPWSALPEESPPPEAPAKRWRSPVPRPAAVPPPRRLPGTRGILRRVAVPRLEEVAHRLRQARHDVHVEDLLESSPPLVRMSLLPWRGPWAASEASTGGRLELGVEGASDAGPISIRSWTGEGAEGPPEVDRVAPAKLDVRLIDERVLAFVKRVLGGV